MPKPYPPQFRRRALELVESGRTVRDVAASLGIAESALHRWRRRDLVDQGRKPGPSSSESTELALAHARIRDLEEEVKILRKAAAAVEAVVPPKERFRLVAELHAEGVRVRQACLALVPLRLLRVGLARAVVALDPARVAQRPDRRDPRRLARHLRTPAGARRARARRRDRGGTQHRRAADASRPAGWAAHTSPRQAHPARDHGQRPGAARLRPSRAQPAVGHRHHRAPDALDSSDRRNTSRWER